MLLKPHSTGPVKNTAFRRFVKHRKPFFKFYFLIFESYNSQARNKNKPHLPQQEMSGQGC